jgi:hypothetical protein
MMQPELLRQPRNPRPALFGLPRLATAYVNTALVTLGLPAVILHAAGDARKGLHLGLVTAAGALVSIGVLYASGSLSDRSRRTDGRTRLAIVGLAAALPPLALLAWGTSYPFMLAATLALIAARSLCDGSHLPILADRFAAARPTRLAAFIAFYHFLGAGLGALVFASGTRWSWGTIALYSPAAVVGMVVTLGALVGFRASSGGPPSVADSPQEPGPPALRRVMGRDLVSLLIARTFFLAGTLIITTFLYYLTRDVLAAENPQRTTGLLYAVAIAGALLFALPVGRLTETVGEVPILFGSGSAIAVVAVLFLVAGSSRPAVAIACMLVYGACSAALIGSGISFLVRLVPHPAVAGRVMAVFTAATFVSQLLASLTGAALLDPLNRARAGAGYLGLVAALELYFALGAVFLLRVGARKTSAERP